MERLKKYLPLLSVLGLLAGLAAGFHTFFMEYLIEPIAALCWALWRIAASLNQKVYWAALIVICTTLMLRLLPARRDHPPNPAYRYRYRPPSRVAYWRMLVEECSSGREQAERLRAGLERLLAASLARSGRPAPGGLEQRIAMGQVPLSPAARRFLYPPGRPGAGYWIDITSLCPAWLRRRAGSPAAQDAAAVSEILDYLETELELNHDP